MKTNTAPRRYHYVKDPDMCRVCRHGINGCPTQKHLGVSVVACLGYMPAMQAV